jgi:hypothetical protein
MFEIKYEIKLNEQGRPCIDLPPDYEQKPEDKFFAIELARYFLQGTYSRMTSPPYDQNTIIMTDIAINLLGQIGDEMAKILWYNMKTAGDATYIMNNKYHTQVNSVEERDKIGKYIVTTGKIYERQEGFKVLVTDEMKIYELQGGITNENWVEIS